jgi:hypothetical protein
VTAKRVALDAVKACFIPLAGDGCTWLEAEEKWDKKKKAFGKRGRILVLWFREVSSFAGHP